MIYSIQRYMIICLMTLFFLLRTNEVYSQQNLLSVPISVDGISKVLEVHPGESIENAAFDFARKNNLFKSNDEEDINHIVSQLVNVLQTKRRENQITQRIERDEQNENIAFTLPITLDNMNTEIKVYNGKTIEESIRSYFDEYGIPNDVRMNIAQQLIEAVQRKINELQLQRQETQQKQPMFSIPITIDNQQVTINHFQNGNPFDEARSICLALGITSIQTMQNIIPQIAHVIQKKIDEMMKPKNLIFSLPINIDGKEVPMPHYAGQTARDSVIQFLQSQNINDNEIINRYAPNLINMIDNYLQDDATKTPLVTIPVNVFGKQLIYKYFEKADPQRSVMDFVQSTGVTNQADFENAFNQILSQLQENLSKLSSVKNASINKENEGRNLVAVLPVSLANNVYNLQLFDDQKPEDVATWFCTDNWAVVKKQMGETFTNEDVMDCISVIHNNLIEKLHETGVVEEVPSENPVKIAQPTGEFKVADMERTMETTIEESKQVDEDTTIENIKKESNEANIKTTIENNTKESKEANMETKSENIIEELLGVQSETSKVNDTSIRENQDVVVDQESSIPSVIDDGKKIHVNNENFTEILTTEEELFNDDNLANKDTLLRVSESEIEERKDLDDKSKNITDNTIDTKAKDSDIVNSINNKKKGKKESVLTSGKPLKPLKLSPKKEILFTLNIDLGDDNFAELNYYKGDKASVVAQRFCNENNLDEGNIPAIIEMIESQLN